MSHTNLRWSKGPVENGMKKRAKRWQLFDYGFLLVFYYCYLFYYCFITNYDMFLLYFFSLSLLFYHNTCAYSFCVLKCGQKHLKHITVFKTTAMPMMLVSF